MFWDQMYRQIEHGGESHISEIYTKWFWNLDTSTLYCHFYHHHINISPKDKDYLVWGKGCVVFGFFWFGLGFGLFF